MFALLEPLPNQKETIMSRSKSGFAPSLAVLLAAGLAACSPQQQQSRPAAMSGQSAAGTQGVQGQAAPGGMQGHSGHTMSGGGMQGHSMAGMDHQSMMNHCAQMRQTVRQGGRLSPDMQQMMAHCDQMDRSMGASRPR
jgi:hypothetical protein